MNLPVTQFIDSSFITEIKAQNNFLLCENETLKKVNAELVAKNKIITEQYESLLRQIRELSNRVYGSQNERYVPPTQGTLFDFSNEFLPPQPEELITVTRRKPRPTTHPHHQIPDSIRRQRIEYTLSKEERLCSCGCGKTLEKIGEVISERLEYKAPEIYAKQHARFKYGGCQNESVILTAGMPTPPIQKSLAGASLLSKVIVDKYEYHQPLHRQQKQLARQGVKLNENSFYDWLCQVFKLLSGLYQLMQRDILSCSIINTDDTPSKVRIKGCQKAKHGFFWIYIGSEDKENLLAAIYLYTETRQGKWAQNFLGNYKGFIQADAYSGYDKLFNEKNAGHDRKEVGCMMHARREFIRIVKSSQKPGAAHQAVGYIQALYKTEEKIKQKTSEERLQIRQRESVPILQKFKEWLEIKANQALPKSPLLKAVNYCLNHWNALTRYTEDGRLNIDNGSSERGMRPIGLGRNNWVALGSHFGGELAALFYSFIETCKIHDINSYEYFTDVLDRIQDHPINRLSELLPYHWKKLRPENSS